MKEIGLNAGFRAVVDDEVFAWLNQYKWTADRHGDICYAVRRLKLRDGRDRSTSLHREILRIPYGDRRIVIHKNGDGLDCRVENLAIEDARAARIREAKQRPKSSRFHGVSWSKSRGAWEARIGIGDRKVFLGRFGSELEAASAYNEFAEANLESPILNDLSQ